MKLRWSRRALKDVAQLRDYIALDSPVYAQQFIGQLTTRLENLSTFPRSGRLAPEAEHNDIREVVYRGYRAIYQLIEARQEIVIVTVVHGSRDLTDPDNQQWEAR
ncbi:MAG: type II toxin-antitoxin system RelE/ParE family toxin [Cellvibrionales bacterium]|jgi:toxin ParE1/3/4|nr:type II toxin-antitoxin system RelE/ParE family toxin [Cellvibrionales bacterium]MBK8675782.1 type II toxin-antitoxin system RelE/ParE family toxin [Cellvibrionales bacterium]HRF88793.1 type II toxin-antitoxin system RelE/ParE family toxin [Pseudomonadales bacterium]HRG49789.1 type II toxin-antitoxin system RelE/ParE family toxin [Pseudomonadales bacterium]